MGERERKIGLARERAHRLLEFGLPDGSSDEMLDSNIITARWLLRSLVAARHGNEAAYPRICVCDPDRHTVLTMGPETPRGEERCRVRDEADAEALVAVMRSLPEKQMAVLYFDPSTKCPAPTPRAP
jgi:hypothetical protein